VNGLTSLVGDQKVTEERYVPRMKTPEPKPATRLPALAPKASEKTPAPASGKVVKPDEIIPLDDSDFSEF
jgi:hypothetical protein